MHNATEEGKAIGRPKGSSPRPGSRKPGRKPGSTKLRGQYTDAQILDYKVEILDLLCKGEALTITEAARKVKVDPVRVHQWASNDKDFQEMLHLARETRADELEVELGHHKNFIPKMMILKGYRPMFRDSYKFSVTNDKLETLLEELRKVKEPQVEILPPPEEEPIDAEYRTTEPDILEALVHPD